MLRAILFDLERRWRLRKALKSLDAEYAKKPPNPDDLTRWAGHLVILAQYGDLKESHKMLKDAVSKLDKALEMSPTKHETLWELGNAHGSIAFLTFDLDAAKIEFDEAFQWHLKAVLLCPGNKSYLRSLKLSATHRPEIHKGMLTDGRFDNLGGGGGSRAAKEAALVNLEKMEPGDVLEEKKWERACKIFQAELCDPAYSNNLAPYGEVVLESLLSSQFACNCTDAVKSWLKGEVSRYVEVAERESPRNDGPMWALGCAHTAIAFLTPDHDAAKIEFDKAFQCFLSAVQVDPLNECYLRSLKSSATHEPNLHKAMYKRSGLCFFSGRAAASSAVVKSRPMNPNFPPNYSVLFCDVAVIAGLLAYVVFTSRR